MKFQKFFAEWECAIYNAPTPVEFIGLVPRHR